MRSRTELTNPVRVYVRGWVEVAPGAGYDHAEGAALPFPPDVDLARLVRENPGKVDLTEVRVESPEDHRQRMDFAARVEAQRAENIGRRYLYDRVTELGGMRGALARRWLT